MSVQASYVSDIYIFCEAVQPAEPGSFIKERKVHLEKEENIAYFLDCIQTACDTFKYYTSSAIDQKLNYKWALKYI